MRKIRYVIPILIIVPVFTFLTFNRITTKAEKNYSVDTPDYYPKDSAVPFYTLKWLNNIKYAKKGILSGANLETIYEGEVVQFSLDKGDLNIDKNSGLNYPFVARIELKNKDGKKVTLFFSQVRYDKAKIFRSDTAGGEKRVTWNEIKPGDYAKVIEKIDLLIANTDEKINFTDKFVNSLTIYLK